MSDTAIPLPPVATRTRLNRSQITGFWAAWAGWTLDGMDSVIYALVLSPALTELLPKSGFKATPGNLGFAGSVLFALFLVGWGLSMFWGPIADRFGRTRVLAATIFVYAIFTGAAALSQSVWQLAVFRLLAGIGIGGEWALAGTYVAEAWPEDRRKMGAGYRLLRRILSGIGAELHGRSAFRLARYVLVWAHARHRSLHRAPPGEGTGTLGAESRRSRHSQARSVTRDLQSSIHTPHFSQHRTFSFGNLRVVGGRRVCTDRNHRAGKTHRNDAGASRPDVIFRHGPVVTGHDSRLPDGSTLG